jgi:hypothetical protein
MVELASSSNNVHGVIDDNSNYYRNMIMDAMRMNHGHVDQCQLNMLKFICCSISIKYVRLILIIILYLFHLEYFFVNLGLKILSLTDNCAEFYLLL